MFGLLPAPSSRCSAAPARPSRPSRVSFPTRQDVIFGNATSKELIAFFSANQLMGESDKLRLLLCYSATHLEKLDETRQSQWQKLARLDASEIKCLRNLEYLGVPVCKREGGSLSSSLSFGKGRRKKSAVRYVPSPTPLISLHAPIALSRPGLYPIQARAKRFRNEQRQLFTGAFRAAPGGEARRAIPLPPFGRRIPVRETPFVSHR